MTKIIVLFPLLILVFCTEIFAAENFQAGFEERRRAVAAVMETATVWIIAEDDERIASGSGFIVGNGYIATNAHVVEKLGKDASVYVLNERIPARKADIVRIASDTTAGGAVGRKDFALLRFDPPKGVELPVLVLNLDVKRMDRVSAWGYPMMATQFDIRTERLQEGDMHGLESPPVIYTEGTVNAIVHARAGDAIVHSAQIAGGNSGGPLVNGRGEVVGMNTWGYREDDEGAFLNGAQPADELARFLTENGVIPKLADGQRLAARPERKPENPPAASRPGKKIQEDRRRDVGRFSVPVPRGWSVVDEDRDGILLGSDDQATAVGIIILEVGNDNLSQVAEALSRKLGGSQPEPDDDIYTFTCSDGDVDTTVFVGETDDEGVFVMISISGDMEKPEVNEILNGIEENAL